MGLLMILAYSALLLLTLLTFALTVICLAIIRTEKRFGHIPGPKRESFFMGSFTTFRKEKKRLGPANYVLLHYWVREYGPVFWIRALWFANVFACSTEVVKELLLNSRHIKPSSLFFRFQKLFGSRYLGYGLVTEINHKKWFHKRALVNPAFRRKNLIGMVDIFNECAEALCQQLAQRADGKTEVLMADEFNNVTLDIIAMAAVSLDANATKSSYKQFGTAAFTSFKGLQWSLDEPFISLFDPRSKSRKFRQEVRAAVGLMRDTGRQCIMERIEARQRGDHVPGDILNTILDGSEDLTRDKDYGMENVLDEFVTLFVAGQDTTSTLLASIFLVLGRNPEVAIKLQAEIDEVLGQKPTIEYEDFAKLEYMTRVIKETLRLYSPAGGSSRVTDYPIKCGDVEIPAGAPVIVLSNVMSRMEEFYDDPLLFNPDRFKNSEDGKLPRHLYAYFPFSIGQRSCIGQHFALMETRVIMGKLLQRFKFRLNQCQRSAWEDAPTLKLVDQCRNYVTLRN